MVTQHGAFTIREATIEDIPAAPRKFTRPDGSAMPNPAAYPRSLEIVEVFRISGGKIVDLRRISSELPFGMKPHE